MSVSDQSRDFWGALEAAIREGQLISLILSNPYTRAGDLPRKQTIRPVVIRGIPQFQWELQFDKKQSHLNLEPAATRQRLREAFGAIYREAYLYTATDDAIARATPEGVRVQFQPPSRKTEDVSAAHDRVKSYLLPEGEPCPFLIALDVMRPSGRVRKSRQKKFRQINRYLELVDDIYRELPDSGTLHVVDFGCGLSYLTFAVHHLLTSIHGRDVEMVGIDQNTEVVTRCRSIAAALNLRGLEFKNDTIESARPPEQLDLAISLHACDTATDSALRFAVGAGAQVILAAPCCQHELSTQLASKSLETLLRHGTLKERIAALATDGLRACALEAAGYRTQLIEFIDLEHTPKNLLLRAVRRESPTSQSRAAREYAALKQLLGVKRLATDEILPARQQTNGQT